MSFTAPSEILVSRRAANEVSPFLHILATAPRIDLDPAGPTVSVVIPARNEERNLSWVARHMPANTHEIILVDGGSTDATVETARALWPNVRVIHQTRRGKGNALACGFHAATGDITVMIDADGSMDPGEIPYFVQALVDGADYAKGSRFTTGGGSSDITALRAWGNRGLNTVTAAVHGTAYSDLCYGYNAFWTRLLPVLGLDPGTPGERSDARLWGDGFEVETLINIRMHAAGLRIAEVPSFEHERLYGNTNLNTFRDGFRVLRTIGLEKLARRRATGPVVPASTSVLAAASVPATASLPAATSVPATGADLPAPAPAAVEPSTSLEVVPDWDGVDAPALFDLPSAPRATDSEIAAEFERITGELDAEGFSDLRHAA